MGELPVLQALTPTRKMDGPELGSFESNPTVSQDTTLTSRFWAKHPKANRVKKTKSVSLI
jgi:hypothetical protein